MRGRAAGIASTRTVEAVGVCLAVAVTSCTGGGVDVGTSAKCKNIKKELCKNAKLSPLPTARLAASYPQSLP